MKSKHIARFSLLVLALVAVMAVGCSDDDDGVNQSNPSKLVGTWSITGVTVDGVSADLADMLEWDETTVGGHVTLNSDFTYSSREFDASGNDNYTQSGTYEVDHNWLIIWAESENGSPITKTQELNAQWSVSGNTLSITHTEGTTTMVMTMTKVTT